MAEGLAATLTLKFTNAAALADALQCYGGDQGVGGLCLQVVKYYDLDDTVLLHFDCGDGAPFAIHGVVSWRKPGFIGVRFHPASGDENRAFLYLRKLLNESRQAPATPPPVAEPEIGPTKPFAEPI